MKKWIFFSGDGRVDKFEIQVWDNIALLQVIMAEGLAVFSWQLLIVCETRLVHSYFAAAHHKC